MSRQITLVTPENIPLTLEPAGIATRFGALLVDMLIQVGVTCVAAIAGAIIAGLMDVKGLSSLALAAIIIAAFLIWFGYFIFFEGFFHGQTPGKRAFGLRVVRDGGYPVDFFSAATRNLIRIADFLPISYAAGALTVFFQPQYKRLGDLVAGTLVIKERPTDPLRAFKIGPDRVSGSLPETVRNPYDVLSPAELGLLRRFVQRRFEMTPDDAERLAYRLIVPLVARLNITFAPELPPRYADLATVLVRTADQREAELSAR